METIQKSITLLHRYLIYLLSAVLLCPIILDAFFPNNRFFITSMVACTGIAIAVGVIGRIEMECNDPIHPNPSQSPTEKPKIQEVK